MTIFDPLSQHNSQQKNNYIEIKRFKISGKAEGKPITKC